VFLKKKWGEGMEVQEIMRGEKISDLKVIERRIPTVCYKPKILLCPLAE